MMRSSRSMLVGIVTLLLVAVAPVDAQRGPDTRRGGQDRARLEQRIRAQMGRMMQERLGLSEAESERLAEVVQNFEGRRRGLYRSEQAVRRRVEALMLEGTVDEAEAAELLTAMTEQRAQEADLFAEEQAALLEVLTPVQVLQLHSLREQIGRRIRALSGGRRGEQGDSTRRRGGRGGGSPGDPMGVGRRER